MIHVACAADENYAPHCAAMLHSLLCVHSPTDVTVYFLHGPRLDRSVLDRFRQLVVGVGSRIEFIEIEDRLVEGLAKRGQVAGVMWYRVLLPERLPALDRILYLDADTLVVDSLLPLWSTNLETDYAAAVSNDLAPEFHHRPAALGLDGPADYFNSGVLLMNLSRLRQENVGAKVLEYARANSRRLMWQDQDPLNVVFAGRWRRLHPRWNCQNSLFFLDHAVDLFGADAVAEARAHPAILHFEGPDPVKPWHYLSKHPHRDRYLYHRRQTPWAEFTPAGRSLTNRLLRPLPVTMMLKLVNWSYRAQRKLQRCLSPRAESPRR